MKSAELWTCTKGIPFFGKKNIQIHSKTAEEVRAPFGLYPQGLKQATWILGPS